jgi:hypothetical protein
MVLKGIGSRRRLYASYPFMKGFPVPSSVKTAGIPHLLIRYRLFHYSNPQSLNSSIHVKRSFYKAVIFQLSV